MTLRSLTACGVVGRGICLLFVMGAAADCQLLAQPPSFAEDVVPVLTRFGCNSGGCHGKLAGQNGFRLSLRGFAPDQDHEALVREGRGRRINPAAPLASLLVKKATGRMPHGGGVRIDPGSTAEAVLRDWIAAGGPGPLREEPRVATVTISPANLPLVPGGTQPLTVTATYSDGRQRDVTWLSQFASGDAGVAEVSSAGIVRALRHGETVVRVAFQGHVEVATVTIPHDVPLDPQQFARRNNAVDDHVFGKLQALRIPPSPVCDDATFLRRAYLDSIGTLPRPDEVRAFLADTAPQKRSQVIDRLLDRPEFADYWALWLGDLLQNRKERDHDIRGSKGVRAMHQWLREQLLARRSWREIAERVLLAQGPARDQPAVGYYVVTVGERDATESEVADSVAQAFLGTRIGCARCHNHPLERFTQDDYYHFVAFFARVAIDRKSTDEGGARLVVGTRNLLQLERQQTEQTLKLAELTRQNAQPLQLQEVHNRLADIQRQIEAAQAEAITVRQPRTNQLLSPQTLDRATLSVPAGSDPRTALVRWMTDPQNEQFSGAMVNRLWKHFLGVGLVEPVDDLRATNPPTNRELWALLNREFVHSNFDLRHLMRLIMNSRTYQASSQSSPENQRDVRFHSHFYARRLPAEVLLDAICQATGEAEGFAGYPQGVRAIQVPDPATESYFLSLFGRSERTTACACERQNDVTLPQLLHMQNGEGLSGKIRAAGGTLRQLVDAKVDDNQCVETLYLSALGRFPSPEERQQVAAIVAGGEREEALGDLFWAILNSKEFVFCH